MPKRAADDSEAGSSKKVYLLIVRVHLVPNSTCYIQKAKQDETASDGQLNKDGEGNYYLDVRCSST